MEKIAGAIANGYEINMANAILKNFLAQNSQKFFIVNIDGLDYGLPSNQIRGIISVKKIDKYLDVDGKLKKTLKFADEDIPVINFENRDLKKENISIIVIEANGIKKGILVDEFVEILKVNLSEYEVLSVKAKDELEFVTIRFQVPKRIFVLIKFDETRFTA